MRDHAVQTLFSLFVSRDRAEAMAGDLVEERQRRGSTWFWLHAARVTLALWRSVWTDAPLATLALAVAGILFLGAAALGGTAAIFLFPRVAGSPLGWIALSVFCWSGAIWTGVTLVSLAPRRGMAACATLAVVLTALMMAFGGWGVWRRPVSAEFVLVAAIGLAAAALVTVGGALARWRAMACLLCVLFVAAPVFSQTEWKDPSPHKLSLITVEEGVQVEVLDWGGSGAGLVLLAGLGGTAHHYDDIAPALTPRYRVIGITRRGHRGSSAAPGGYGFARLAEDVLRVIDVVGLENPVVIGHSFAGEEMHVLGARHSARIRGLVYVDAAFDRGDDADTAAFTAAARLVPAAPGAQAADLASFTALRAYLDKYGGAGPEGWLRTRYRTNPDGTVAGAWAPDRPVVQAMSKEIQAAYHPYKPEPVRVPALAIYACPKSADDLMRRGSSDRAAFPELVAKAAGDSVLREQVEKLYLLTRERVRRHENWFAALAERGRVVELSGTHNLVISNARDVLDQIEAFVSSLPKRPPPRLHQALHAESGPAPRRR